MNLGDYLDSTYLKTDGQAQISNIETKRNVIALIEEAITNDFKLVMIRQEYISVAKRLIADLDDKSRYEHNLLWQCQKLFGHLSQPAELLLR